MTSTLGLTLIEGHEVIYPVREYGSGKARVVRVFAEYRMLRHHLPPEMKDGGYLVFDREEALKFCQNGGGIGGVQSQAVVFAWGPGSHNPKFVERLG